VKIMWLRQDNKTFGDGRSLVERQATLLAVRM
jgi:hypothetical protein